jgi:hypothetical protein
VPRTHGFPKRIEGSMTMRLRCFMVAMILIVDAERKFIPEPGRGEVGLTSRNGTFRTMAAVQH